MIKSDSRQQSETKCFFERHFDMCWIYLQWANFCTCKLVPSCRFEVILLKSSRKYDYYRIPNRYPSETRRRSIGDQDAWPETHWRPIFPIGDRHAWSQTHQRPTSLIGLWRHVGLRWVITGMSISFGFPTKHVGLRLCMLISDGSPVKHVGLRLWACRSAISLLKCVLFE